jgi:hypothetical protein
VRPLRIEPEQQGPYGRLVQRAHGLWTLAAGARASGSYRAPCGRSVER